MNYGFPLLSLPTRSTVHQGSSTPHLHLESLLVCPLYPCHNLVDLVSYSLIKLIVDYYLQTTLSEMATPILASCSYHPLPDNTYTCRSQVM